MAYPARPKSVEGSLDSGQVKIPELPKPPALDRPSATGGAPKLMTDPPVGVPQLATDPPMPRLDVPRNDQQQFVPFWQRGTPVEGPEREVIHPPSPWKREDVEKDWGKAIENLADRLWERYKGLPPERKALASWQMVAANPQEAARSILTRAHINQAQVSPRMTDSAQRSLIGNSDLYQWFNKVRGNR